jgi:predicted GIY-YIG superfamily endonuclease
MAQAKKKAGKTQKIDTGLLKKVNARMFDKYRKEIAEMLEGRKGLYALYRKNKLYYLGRASDLKDRIKHHVKDRHQDKWTHFSLYVSQKADRIKELESALLKTASKEGKDKLKAIEDILPKLKGQVGKRIKEEYEDLLKSLRNATRKVKSKAKTGAKKKTKAKPKAKAKAKTRDKSLKELFPRGKVVYATYKDKEYKAWILSSGELKYKGKVYTSPSAAGKAVTRKGTVNGWNFWKYKDKSGRLRKIGDLRKTKRHR